MWRTPSGSARGRPRQTGDARALDDHARCCSIHGAAPVAVSRPRAMPPARGRETRVGWRVPTRADRTRGAPRDASTPTLGRGGRLRRRRVFVFPPRHLLPAAAAGGGRARILPRPDEAPVPGAPRSHGDERIPRATPLGRPRLRRPRSLRHETHRARHGTGGESPTRRRRARPETRAHRRLPALPRVAHRGPRLRGPRRRGGRRRAAQSHVIVRQRTRVPRLGRRSNGRIEIAHDFPGWCLRETREVHGDVWWYTGDGDGAGTGTGTGTGSGTGSAASSSTPRSRRDIPGDARGARTRARGSRRGWRNWWSGSARGKSPPSRSSRTGGFCFPSQDASLKTASSSRWTSPTVRPAPARCPCERARAAAIRLRTFES